MNYIWAEGYVAQVSCAWLQTQTVKLCVNFQRSGGKSVLPSDSATPGQNNPL